VTAQPLHSTGKIAEVAEIRLLVKTTSVGPEPNDPPLFVCASLFAPIMACDPMYHPSETPLLRAARAGGWPARNGLLGVVQQGPLAFER
jgi:shikimate 5-dehydrogenase